MTNGEKAADLTYAVKEVCIFFPQLLSDKGEYEEAMELLKKALKLEPTTKVRERTAVVKLTS